MWNACLSAWATSRVLWKKLGNWLHPRSNGLCVNPYEWNGSETLHFWNGSNFPSNTGFDDTKWSLLVFANKRAQNCENRVTCHLCECFTSVSNSRGMASRGMMWYTGETSRKTMYILRSYNTICIGSMSCSWLVEVMFFVYVHPAALCMARGRYVLELCYAHGSWRKTKRREKRKYAGQFLANVGACHECWNCECWGLGTFCYFLWIKSIHIIKLF